MNLVEKALSYSKGQRHPKQSSSLSEESLLTLAYLEGKVRGIQLRYALGLSSGKGFGGNQLYTLIKSLREECLEKKLRLVALATKPAVAPMRKERISHHPRKRLCPVCRMKFRGLAIHQYRAHGGRNWKHASKGEKAERFSSGDTTHFPPFPTFKIPVKVEA